MQVSGLIEMPFYIDSTVNHHDSGQLHRGHDTGGAVVREF